MTHVPQTLTDDGIDNVLSNLAEFIEEQFKLNLDADDEGFEALREKLHELLEPYSNGYRNYN